MGKPQSTENRSGGGGRELLKQLAGKAEAFCMLVAGVSAAALLASTYEQSVRDGPAFDGVSLAGVDVSGLSGDAMEDAAALASAQALDRPLTLRAEERSFEVTARDLGARPSPQSAIDSALRVGRTGNFFENLRARDRARRGEIDIPVGLLFDERPALDRLLSIAPEVETTSLPTRLDLDARKVLPASTGVALLPYDSLSTVAIGLASGETSIDLVTADREPAEDPLAQYQGLDVSVVLGTFSTPYSMDGAKADRTHNLKLGAAALDGLILEPGEELSFNDVVGPRSAEAGYRYAPGITSGQIVDVLGGGICQVASSLNGAAFFGGLEIVKSRPHSRPSSYVDMGLDATVVYPVVDLVLKNPYDFPVALHMTVNQGKVVAEVLGPRRPYQVAFERQIKERTSYNTIVRHDQRLLTGTEALAQRGMRGFKVKRVRKFYEAGEEVRSESWDLDYPATTEIVRRGTNPAGEAPEDKPKLPLRDPQEKMRIVQ